LMAQARHTKYLAVSSKLWGSHSANKIIRYQPNCGQTLQSPSLCHYYSSPIIQCLWSILFRKKNRMLYLLGIRVWRVVCHRLYISMRLVGCNFTRKTVNHPQFVFNSTAPLTPLTLVALV
jgi:hypothetical protein